MSRQGIRALLHTTSKGSLSLKTNISSSISIRSCSLLLPSLSQLPLFASSASTSTLQSSILRSFHKSAPLSSSPGVDESSVNNGELKSRVPRKYNNSSPHNRRNDGNRHRGGDGQKRNQNYNHNKRQQSRRDVVFNKPTEPIVEEDGRINFGLITTDWQLKQFLPHIKEAEIVGVDTEFLSFPHYRANLEILQAATPTAIACLDYQALKNKMVPFMEVMMEKHLILHAAGMDLQVFYDFADRYKLDRKFPTKVYDTQVVAAFAGYGDYLGYGPLIDKVVGEDIDKGATMTDWSLRPLSEEQIEYALNDVRYLHRVKDVLDGKVKALNRESWADEQLAAVTSDRALEQAKPQVPEEAWKRLKRTGKLNWQGLAILRELAAWREREAREKNKHIQILIRDETMVAVAASKASTREKLAGIQGMKPPTLNFHCDDLLACVERGMQVAEEDAPLRDRPLPVVLHDQPGYSKLMPLLRTYVQSVCVREKISQMYLAPTDDLEAFAKAFTADLENDMEEAGKDLLLMQGWRRELLGNDLMKIKKGHPVKWDPETFTIKVVDDVNEE